MSLNKIDQSELFPGKDLGRNPAICHRGPVHYIIIYRRRVFSSEINVAE